MSESKEGLIILFPEVAAERLKAANTNWEDTDFGCGFVEEVQLGKRRICGRNTIELEKRVSEFCAFLWGGIQQTLKDSKE